MKDIVEAVLEERLRHDRFGRATRNKKASGQVQHLLLPCQWQERVSLIPDLIRAKAPREEMYSIL